MAQKAAAAGAENANPRGAHSIEHRPVSDLIPYARNARTHSEAQVAQIAGSIREFGFNNPILVDGENGIIAGHGRVLAARKLKLATVPVGDMWALGKHRLICGDATDAGTVARLFDGVSPHLMVTDPPYGVMYDPAWRKARSGDTTSMIFYLKTQAFWRELDRMPDSEPDKEEGNGHDRLQKLLDQIAERKRRIGVGRPDPQDPHCAELTDHAR